MDRVLTEAESLPADEQVMLEDLLRQRRLEAWRRETADDARQAAEDFRAGKLKNHETVVDGIDQAVVAFLGLFEGKNIGKMVMKLA